MDGRSMALDVPAADPLRPHCGPISRTLGQCSARSLVDPVDLCRVVRSCGNDRVPVHREGHSSPHFGTSRSLRLDTGNPHPVGRVIGKRPLRRDLKWLQLPYFAWQFFHFHKQNVGMVALASTSSGLRGPSAPERRAMSTAASFGVLGLLARPGLLQLGDQTPLRGFYVLALLGFICAVVWGVTLLLLRPGRERSVGVATTYLVVLLFFTPVFLFRSPYAAVGGMTIGHGLQYLLLVGLVAAGRSRGKNRAVDLALLFNLALLGGVLLSAASHLHDAPALGRALFGVYLGVAMAHFVIDAGIWRLREPFAHAFMASRVPFLVPPVRSSLGDRS